MNTFLAISIGPLRLHVKWRLGRLWALSLANHSSIYRYCSSLKDTFALLLHFDVLPYNPCWSLSTQPIIHKCSADFDELRLYPNTVPSDLLLAICVLSPYVECFFLNQTCQKRAACCFGFRLHQISCGFTQGFMLCSLRPRNWDCHSPFAQFA